MRAYFLVGGLAVAIIIDLASSTPVTENYGFSTESSSERHETSPVPPNDSSSINNKANSCPCLSNKDFSGPPKQHNVVIYGMSCACSLNPQYASRRDDYHFTPGIGFHKLHTRALVWNEARKFCNEEGAHLAIVNSLFEAKILVELFNKSGPIIGAAYPDEALIGIHDLYKEKEWVTIEGESLGKAGYTEWSNKWGGQPDNGGGRQNCGAFMKEGALDDVACDVPFPFFCEFPVMKFR